jgi:hypothetical protein
MLRRKGHTYTAQLQIAFTEYKQAANFAHEQTLVGRQVAVDLEDEAVLALFEKDEELIIEVSFEDGYDEAVQEELIAASMVGAEFELGLEWVKNA